MLSSLIKCRTLSTVIPSIINEFKPVFESVRPYAVSSYLSRICPNTYVALPFKKSQKGFNCIDGRYDPSSPFPPDTGSSPLTLQYPFAVDYLKNRELPLYNPKGEQVSTVQLDGKIYNDKVRLDILHSVVRYLRAKWQQGTHKTKGRHEVRGGGRKPRPQKGTGNSRQGSIRSPLWVGGGCTFPKIPRSHAHKLPTNIIRIGLRSALSAKANEGRLFVLENFTQDIESYEQLRASLDIVSEGAPGFSYLLVDSGECGEDYAGVTLRRWVEGAENVEVISYHDLTVYHMLKYHKLVLTAPAVQGIVTELKRPIGNPKLAEFWERRQESLDSAVELLRQKS
uniref:Large ribosomal subunit protein uL4m n=1 Tax=Polytomella parva TaxID=51329 RepID=A0A7S0UN74_9CHLO|mmetsp:Transcript_11874/g.21303  ORF Transcript_11874/g.21303 Transcript_11874/m.21303 type:complete len:339 (+) Transcript_11874:105-1121(+)